MRPRRRRLYEQLLAGMVEVVAAKGYPEARVEDVIEAAGVSRFTFYECFENKERCYLAAYEALVERVEARLGDATVDGKPWPQRVQTGIQALIELIEAEPQIASYTLIEVFAAGPDARRLYRQALERLGAGLEQGFAAPKREWLPANISTMALGAALGLVVERLRSEDEPDFRTLAPDLCFSLLMPYLGPDAAAEETNAAYAFG